MSVRDGLPDSRTTRKTFSRKGIPQAQQSRGLSMDLLFLGPVLFGNRVTPYHCRSDRVSRFEQSHHVASSLAPGPLVVNFADSHGRLSSLVPDRVHLGRVGLRLHHRLRRARVHVAGQQGDGRQDARSKRAGNDLLRTSTSVEYTKIPSRRI